MSKKAIELPPLEILDDLLAYDKETGEFLHRHREAKHFNATAKRTKESLQEQWNGRYAGTVAGSASSSTGYHVMRIFGKDYLAHRLAYLMSTGVDPLDMSIDHINHDRLDNSFSNLRIVSHAENHRNRRVQVNSSSGSIGISAYQSKPHCWVGRVQVDGRQLRITNPRTGYGYFEDFERPVLERMIADKYRELGFHNNHGQSKQN